MRLQGTFSGSAACTANWRVKVRSLLCSYGYRRFSWRKGSCPVAVRRDMFGTEADTCSVSFGEKGSHSSDEMHQHFLGSRMFPKFQKVVRLSTALTISCPSDLRSRATRSCRPPSRQVPLPLY